MQAGDSLASELPIMTELWEPGVIWATNDPLPELTEALPLKKSVQVCVSMAVLSSRGPDFARRAFISIRNSLLAAHCWMSVSSAGSATRSAQESAEERQAGCNVRERDILAYQIMGGASGAPSTGLTLMLREHGAHVEWD
jgi:hypothetical protein